MVGESWTATSARGKQKSEVLYALVVEVDGDENERSAAWIEPVTLDGSALRIMSGAERK